MGFFSLSPDTNLSDVGAELQNLYPVEKNTINFNDLFSNFKSFLNKVLKQFYDLGLNPNNASELFVDTIFEKNADKILKGVDVGFGSVRYGNPSFELLQNLRQSAIYFAANKTFVQASELSSLLVRQDGTIRPFGEFSKMARPILQKYNQTWLKTEYDIAIRRARAAKDYKKAQDTADLYPNLKYLVTTSIAPRDSHLGFVGTVLPVNHPFWQSNLPPSEWNCKCSFEPTDEPETAEPQELPNYVPGLNFNPTLSGKIFDESHPYFQSVGVLDQSQNDIIESSLLKLVEKSTSLTSDTISNGIINMQISAEGFLGILGKPNSQQIKKLLLINDAKSFKEAFRSSTFEGEKEGKSYYSFMLGDIKNFFVLTSDNYLLDITETF